jgi:tetratricopeptide (TPR) repeat protein
MPSIYRIGRAFVVGALSVVGGPVHANKGSAVRPVVDSKNEQLVEAATNFVKALDKLKDSLDIALENREDKRFYIHVDQYNNNQSLASINYFEKLVNRELKKTTYKEQYARVKLADYNFKSNFRQALKYVLQVLVLEPIVKAVDTMPKQFKHEYINCLEIYKKLIITSNLVNLDTITFDTIDDSINASTPLKLYEANLYIKTDIPRAIKLYEEVLNDSLWVNSHNESAEIIKIILSDYYSISEDLKNIFQKIIEDKNTTPPKSKNKELKDKPYVMELFIVFAIVGVPLYGTYWLLAACCCKKNRPQTDVAIPPQINDSSAQDYSDPLLSHSPQTSLKDSGKSVNLMPVTPQTCLTKANELQPKKTKVFSKEINLNKVPEYFAKKKALYNILEATFFGVFKDHDKQKKDKTIYQYLNKLADVLLKALYFRRIDENDQEILRAFVWAARLDINTSNNTVTMFVKDTCLVEHKLVLKPGFMSIQFIEVPAFHTVSDKFRPSAKVTSIKPLKFISTSQAVVKSDSISLEKPKFNLKDEYAQDLLYSLGGQKIQTYHNDHLNLSDLSEDILETLNNIAAIESFETAFLEGADIDLAEFKFSAKDFHRAFINKIIRSIVDNSDAAKVLEEINNIGSLFFTFLKDHMESDEIIAITKDLRNKIRAQNIAISYTDETASSVEVGGGGGAKTDNDFVDMSFDDISALVRRLSVEYVAEASINKVLEKIQDPGKRKFAQVRPRQGDAIQCHHVSVGIIDGSEKKNFTVFFNVTDDAIGNSNYKLLALGRHGGPKNQSSITYQCFITHSDIKGSVLSIK